MEKEGLLFSSDIEDDDYLMDSDVGEVYSKEDDDVSDVSEMYIDYGGSSDDIFEGEETSGDKAIPEVHKNKLDDGMQVGGDKP